jgi:hypothetical protein
MSRNKIYSLVQIIKIKYKEVSLQLSKILEIGEIIYKMEQDPILDHQMQEEQMD